jgi:hypothetical protein
MSDIYHTQGELTDPWNSKRGCALMRIVCTATGKRGAILNEVLNQDTPEVPLNLVDTFQRVRSYEPSNSPLLKGDNATADFLRRNLRLVDWNHGGSNANAEAGNNSSDAKECNAVGGCLKAAPGQYKLISVRFLF